VQVPRESADRPEPHRMPVLPTSGERRPRHRVLDCDPVDPLAVQVVQKLAEEDLGPLELVAKRPAHRQVLSH